MSQDLKFTTNISGNTPQGIVIRNEKLETLIHEADFVSTFFLSLVGRKPENVEKTILNAILVSAIDHEINTDGGAITDAMSIIQTINEDSLDIEKACEKLIDSYIADKKIIPGFGHPVYDNFDPRAKELFDLARKNNLEIQFMNIVKQLEHSLDDKLGYKIKKKLILNIDGAIAALLLTLGIDPLAGNAIFGLARVAGSISHIVEEQKSGIGARLINEKDVEYIST